MDRVTDVVVVGFGAAGSAAAIEAADAGAEVLILERMRRPGGATVMSGGVVYAAGTSIQKAAGVTDTADEMYELFMGTDSTVREPAVTRVLADKSAEAIEWLINLGADFRPENLFSAGSERIFAHITPPKPRSHHVAAPPGKKAHTGPQLFAVLEKAVKARKIAIMFQTRGSELVRGVDGQVIGVKACSEGNEVYVRARRAVVLADGGFARNPDMVKQFLFLAPYVAAGKIALTSHPGQSGDGIRMAMAIGADLCGMAFSHAWPLPFISVGETTSIFPARRYPSIYVNKLGMRFVNEDYPATVVSPALDKQDSVAFQIFDGRAMKEAHIPQSRLKLLVSAPTIRELALKLGITAERFENTVEQWNQHAATGEDPEFGKKGATVGPMNTPPFWGGELPRGLNVNYGGLKTNAKAQVLRVLDGNPFPRLYAAGQTTGGRLGAFYPGPGCALADCFVFGRIAGQNAAAETPWE